MKTKLTYQNYGSAILIFIEGNTTADAYEKYLSLYNWNATSSEATEVAEGIISCWSTLEKFQKYLWDIHENRLWHNVPKDCKNPMDIAVRAYLLMQQDFANTPHETHRSVNNNFTMVDFGTIEAEKPDMDFKDAVLAHAFGSQNTYREAA